MFQKTKKFYFHLEHEIALNIKWWCLHWMPVFITSSLRCVFGFWVADKRDSHSWAWELLLKKCLMCEWSSYSVSKLLPRWSEKMYTGTAFIHSPKGQQRVKIIPSFLTLIVEFLTFQKVRRKLPITTDHP